MSKEELSESVSKPWLSNREWLFVITIILFIGYICLLHHRSISAQNYISFTGTIVSIIVGVLAIVYAMLESVRQNISGQKLQAGAESIEKAATGLEAKLEKLDLVRDEIISAKTEIQAASKMGANLIIEATNNLDLRMNGLDASRTEMVGEIKDLKVILQERIENISAQKEETSFDAITEEMNASNILNLLTTAPISTIVPFVMLILSLKRNMLFIHFVKDEEFINLTSDLNGNYFINPDSVFLGMAILHDLLVPNYLIVRRNKVWSINPTYQELVMQKCKEIAVRDFERDVWSTEHDLVKKVIPIITEM